MPRPTPRTNRLQQDRQQWQAESNQCREGPHFDLEKTELRMKVVGAGVNCVKLQVWELVSLRQGTLCTITPAAARTDASIRNITLFKRHVLRPS